MVNNNVILIRHGFKLYGNKNRSKIPYFDPPLIPSPKNMVWNFIKNDNSIIISSPFLRAIQTKEELFPNHDFIIDADVREYLGNNTEDSKITDENSYIYFNENTYKYLKNCKTTTETIYEFENRLKRFIYKLQNTYENKTIYIITHGFVINKISNIFNIRKNYYPKEYEYLKMYI